MFDELLGELENQVEGACKSFEVLRVRLEPYTRMDPKEKGEGGPPLQAMPTALDRLRAQVINVNRLLCEIRDLETRLEV